MNAFFRLLLERQRPVPRQQNVMKESDLDTTDQVNPQVPSPRDGTTSLWERYRNLPRNVFAIGLVSLLNDASSEIIYPLLPVFLTTNL
jgi:hypothetical protein